jgi:hypothetical protein
MNVINHPGNANKRGKEEEDSVKGVADAVVEGRLALFWRIYRWRDDHHRDCKVCDKRDRRGLCWRGSDGAYSKGGGGRYQTEGGGQGSSVEGSAWEHWWWREERTSREAWLSTWRHWRKSVVESALKAMGRDHKHCTIQGTWVNKEGVVVDMEEWGEVLVAKGLDWFGGVAGNLPQGEPFGVDGGQLMNQIAIMVKNTLSSISKGANEGDKKNGESRVGGVASKEWELGLSLVVLPVSKTHKPSMGLLW